jgi:hypothetical protein
MVNTRFRAATAQGPPDKRFSIAPHNQGVKNGSPSGSSHDKTI